MRTSHNPSELSLVPGGAPLFQRIFTRLGCDGRPPRFRVEFYPYSSLVLTIRRREEAVAQREAQRPTPWKALRRCCLAASTGAERRNPWSSRIWNTPAPAVPAAA